MKASQIFEQQILPLFEESQSQWLKAARATAFELGRRGGRVTIDDVRERCPPPANADPRIMGAVFLRKDWDALDYRQSSRVACHGRPVRVFRLKRSATGKDVKP